MVSAIRQALIYNQDDDGLKETWFDCFAARKQPALLQLP